MLRFEVRYRKYLLEIRVRPAFNHERTQYAAYVRVSATSEITGLGGDWLALTPKEVPFFDQIDGAVQDGLTRGTSLIDGLIGTYGKA